MRHVLITGRFQAELHLDEKTGQILVEWSPHPPRTSAQCKQVQKAYIPWRNDILAQWTLRSGMKTMLAEYNDKGDLIATEFESGKILSLGKAIYHNPNATPLE